MSELPVDPNLGPVPQYNAPEPAKCPPDAGRLTGGGLGSFGVPRFTIGRWLLNAVPFVGSTLAALILPEPTNAAAVAAAQEDLQVATSRALGATLVVDADTYRAMVDLLRVTVGDARTPGYVTTCAEIVAQDLNEQLTLIVINALFLFVMLVAIIWAL